MIHTDEQVEEELNLYVDLGAKVEDVFVYHKVYGVIRAEMNIRSRRDVRKYMEDISSGKSTNLMKLTSKIQCVCSRLTRKGHILNSIYPHFAMSVLFSVCFV